METRREDRHLVHVAGAYRARQSGSRQIWIKDVSEYGCRFFDKFSVLRVGTEVLLKLGNIGPLDAHVRWREGNIVGAEFVTPLHPSVLGHISEFMSEDAG
ncbi:PilZ domain-containing protein [Qipengyuania gaetbuli]|uniref:PilZ domain-containing protein n=1 Tax=Qipengyuania gaetbuli TaxID=266952 RepID=UPI001CFEDE34|nr:PilZ domain-containing protein [Qipengyuania gaetbuli]